MSRVAVFSAGSWGTAFAMVLADAGSQVVLWARRPEVAGRIADHHENPDYLPDVRLPEAIRATTDPREALDGADFVVFSLPAQSLREGLTRWAPHIPPDAVLVSLIKGIESGTCMRASEVIREVTGAGPERIAVVSGPNLALEIAARSPAASVVACADAAVAERLQKACHSPYFRPYTNTDVTGCELGGAVKNVIGLASGIAEGMGLGDNAKASLITRGLAETARLGVALGADPYTFAGLAGLGDLVATCASPLSRNNRFGRLLGEGRTVAQAQEEVRQTTEGVKSCGPVLELARAHGVEMPIVETVVAVVHGGRSPREMLTALLSRSTKSEGLY